MTFTAEEFSRIWALMLARLEPGTHSLDAAAQLLARSAVEYIAIRGRIDDGRVSVEIGEGRRAVLTRYVSPLGVESLSLDVTGPDGAPVDTGSLGNVIFLPPRNA